VKDGEFLDKLNEYDVLQKAWRTYNYTRIRSMGYNKEREAKIETAEMKFLWSVADS
jgi:hypothetical protein